MADQSLKIPWQDLSDETLNAVIEDFVTREGTEYGHSEVSLETKIMQVKTQLQANHLYISYDSDSGSVSLHVVDG